MRKKTIAIIACLFLAAAVSPPWLMENHCRSDTQPKLDEHALNPILWETFSSLSEEDFVRQVHEDKTAVPLEFTIGGKKCSEVHTMVDGEELAYRFDKDNHLVAYRLRNASNSSVIYDFAMDYGAALDLFNEYRSHAAQYTKS